MLLQLMLPQHFPREIAGSTYRADVVPLSSVYFDMILVFSTHPFGELLSTVLTMKDHVLFFSVHHT